MMTRATYKSTTTYGRFVNYMRKTWKNKVCAIALIGLSYVPVIIDNDGSAFVLMTAFAIPMFFTKSRWFI